MDRNRGSRCIADFNANCAIRVAFGNNNTCGLQSRVSLGSLSRCRVRRGFGICRRAKALNRDIVGRRTLHRQLQCTIIGTRAKSDVARLKSRSGRGQLSLNSRRKVCFGNAALGLLIRCISLCALCCGRICRRLCKCGRTKSNDILVASIDSQNKAVGLRCRTLLKLNRGKGASRRHLGVNVIFGCKSFSGRTKSLGSGTAYLNNLCLKSINCRFGCIKSCLNRANLSGNFAFDFSDCFAAIFKTIFLGIPHRDMVFGKCRGICTGCNQRIFARRRHELVLLIDCTSEQLNAFLVNCRVVHDAVSIGRINLNCKTTGVRQSSPLRVRHDKIIMHNKTFGFCCGGSSLNS